MYMTQEEQDRLVGLADNKLQKMFISVNLISELVSIRSFRIVESNTCSESLLDEDCAHCQRSGTNPLGPDFESALAIFHAPFLFVELDDLGVGRTLINVLEELLDGVWRPLCLSLDLYQSHESE